MKRHIIIVAIALLSTVVKPMIKDPSYWQQISLPNIYVAPATNSLTINGKSSVFKYTLKNEGTPDKIELKMPDAMSFVIKFPTAKMEWFLQDQKCLGGKKDKFASTQIRLRSDHIKNIYGLSFLGSIQNKQLGTSRENHFSIFFHIEECYVGGPEYGFAFYENGKTALFYNCGNCNLNNQYWWDWPGLDRGQIGNENVNDPGNKVANALNDPSQERYYNIQVTKAGDFVVQVIDPKTWQKSECIIKKPTWFPNVYGKGGYITVNAKRNDDSRANMGSWDLQAVKVWQ